MLAAASVRPHYYTQELLTSLPADKQLLVGGDINCIAGQQDMLDPAGQPDQWTQDRPAACRDGSPALRCLAGPSPQQACLHPHSHLRPVSSAAGSLADIKRSVRLCHTVVGYPEDHLGVSLSLNSPASTLYGSAAWRLPLHLLDDQPFCEHRAAEIPAYLAARPLGDAVTRGSRWVDLKRQVKDIALQRSWAIAAEHRAAQRALESDSNAALAAYEQTPTAETLLAGQDAHHLLQALHTEAAKGAALQAWIVWQFYGEQSSFWFHHLARERQCHT